MAKDFYHNHVREALEKSGWTITHDPLRLSPNVLDYEVDFGAQQLFAAEKGPEKIAVEVKNFLGISKVNELHRMVGQFINYRYVLQREQADRHLFLAIPLAAWNSFFKLEPVLGALADGKCQSLDL